ncbi:MAG: YggS family pyridoxal phosphate-dependent enzyme [Actinobacteria bacterium]|nr:YggS family pyridoxal phosphate-dependent enzyme [Actinomycetota bacterium]
MGNIAGNLESVWQRIGEAAGSCGRDIGDVKLVAVSKGRSPEAILEAVRAGQYVFGENRAQEFRAKMERLEADLEWHFIGHLQRNKVNMVVGKVALIHSVDSRRLLESVAARAGELEVVQDILLQVNVSGEESKYGMQESEVERTLAAALDLPGVRVRGLMTIAPLGSPEEARTCFRRLRELEDKLVRDHPVQDLDILSMGMTQDFEVALEEGANMVRIGTAIFAA